MGIQRVGWVDFTEIDSIDTSDTYIRGALNTRCLFESGNSREILRERCLLVQWLVVLVDAFNLGFPVLAELG